MSKIFNSIQKAVTDEGNRKIFNVSVYSLLGLVSLVMTILNIYTHKGLLTVATGVFAVLCLGNILLTVFSDRFVNLAKIIFAFEVIVMFTYFLISGNPDGFSAIWICMLPPLGLFFFDRIKGTVICSCMFLLLAFFLWTPLGNSLLRYNYNSTFKTRFPILYLAFLILAYFLETLRVSAYNKIQEMENYYKELSIRDSLTGMYNRQGMYSQLENNDRFKRASKVGAVMFDIDHFKEVNDTYGHKVGDIVLKSIADIIKKNLGILICRWGGEEFVAIYPDEAITFAELEQLRRMIEKNVFTVEKGAFGVTISIGICEEDNFDVENIDLLIDKADKALYEAKNTGRNRTVRF